jgi:hypothetical protein
MGLLPSDRSDLDKPWEGTCQVRLWGEGPPKQPREVVLYLRYAVARPDEKGLARGGWLRSCAVTQSLLGTAPRFLFRECAHERGLTPWAFHDNWVNDPMVPTTGGVYVCDYNRDGILDLLVTDVSRFALFQGLPGGKFRDVTTEMGLPRAPQGNRNYLAAFADLDGDGWDDLILGRQVYRNEQGKRFVNVSDRCNLVVPPDATGAAVADYDRDGRLDLYFTRSGAAKEDSWVSGRGGGSLGNRLWRNLGDWRFQDVTRKSGTSAGKRSCFSAVWLDADNDGWPDLYVINEFGDGVLFLNNRDGTFRPRHLADGPPDFGSMGLAAGDIDNDGHIDLYTANMYSKAGSRVFGNVRPDAYPPDLMAKMRTFVAGSQLHRNRGGLRFQQRGKEWQLRDVGWSYGPQLVDLDNDGYLDLYATCGYISRSRTEPDG